MKYLNFHDIFISTEQMFSNFYLQCLILTPVPKTFDSRLHISTVSLVSTYDFHYNFS